MKRNGLAERDRCIIERLSRNHTITPPVLNMLTTWRDLAINRHEENLVGEYSKDCRSFWQSPTVYQWVVDGEGLARRPVLKAGSITQ